MKEKMKNFVNKFFQNGRGILVAIFVLEVILMMFITPNRYDDEFFITQVTNVLNEETGEIIEHNVIDFVTGRYFTWSSRVIIEFVLCMVLKTSKYLWVLIEALMMTLAYYSMSKLFVKENSRENNVMLLFMILIYPFNVMNSTGWASSTINYIWPLATCLYSLIPIKMIWNKEKIKLWQYPLFSLSLLFACNHEQTCAILVGTYLLFALFMIIRDKKINIFMVLQSVLAIASIIFILTCPGNYLRKEKEMELMPDYKMLTVLDKVILGVTATMGDFVKEAKLSYALLTFIIMMFIVTNYKEKLYRVVASIPFVSFMLLTYGNYFTKTSFYFISYFKNFVIQENVVLTAANCNNLFNVMPIIFAFANFICIVLSIALIFKNLKNNLALLIFMIGFASKIIIGFSPTVFSSNARTSIFLEFAMIIISILIWQEFSNKNDKNEKRINRTGMIIKSAGILQYINVFLCILTTQK